MSKNRKKPQEVDAYLSVSMDSEDEMSFDEFVSKVESAVSVLPDHQKQLARESLRLRVGGDSYLHVEYKRLETPDEVARRVRIETRMEEDAKARDLQELKRLMKKYPNG